MLNSMNFILIVPAYNAEKYLERCIYSVTTQGVEDCRTVIINDGSTDMTGEIADRLAHDNPRVSVIHQENQGQILARSKGIDFALRHFADEKSFFMFLDADDELKQGALTRIIQLIKENDCDLLFFGVENVDLHTGQVTSIRCGGASGLVVSKADLYKIVLYDVVYNPMWCKVISRKLIRSTDYQEYSHLRHGEDLIQSLAYYRAAERTFFSGEILYRYYTNPESVTRSVDFYSYPMDSAVRKATWEFVTQENVWTEEELNAYAQFLLNLLERKIVTLCSFKVPVKDKIKALEKVHQDSFYTMLLRLPLKHSLLVKLLLNKRYKAVASVAKAVKLKAYLKSHINK